MVSPPPTYPTLAYEDGEPVVGVLDLQLQVALEDRVGHLGRVELEDADVRVDEQLPLRPVGGTNLLETETENVLKTGNINTISVVYFGQYTNSSSLIILQHIH